MVERKKVKKLEIDFSIPKFLQDDIDLFVNCYNSEQPTIDCEFCNLQASINMADSSQCISHEHAEMLRNYYVRGKIFDDSREHKKNERY